MQSPFYLDPAAGPVVEKNDSFDPTDAGNFNTVVTPQYANTDGNSYDYDDRADGAADQKSDRQSSAVADKDSKARHAARRDTGYSSYAGNDQF